ncbi:MAG: hypothetical protein GXY74_00655 [Phycisphaerae bacterium]|nr:hypothetical protein [Phycisphaerae bacterium]
MTTLRSEPHAAGVARGRAARMPVLVCVAVLPLAAAGCLELKDHLTLRPDGSGTVRIEAVVDPSASQGRMVMSMAGGRESVAVYPPLDEEAARRMFAGDGMQVAVEHKAARDGVGGVVVNVEFKDIHALVAGPYGRAHSLWLGREGDTLVLKARTGVQALAYMDELAKGKGMGMIPVDLSSIPASKDKLKVEFTITLPGAAEIVGSTPGAAADGNAVTWTADATQKQPFEQVAAALDGVLSVRCPAGDIKPPAAGPMRLDLAPLAELKEAQSADAPPAVDAEAILAAARFVPISLQVMRSFNLSGGDFHGGNAATLSGAVVLPQRFAPVRWGRLVIEEATDDRGRTLLGATDGRDNGVIHWGGSGDDESDEDADLDRVVHHVSATMKPPGVEAAHIATLKGGVAMFYPGVTHLLRVENAVPAAAIIDVSDGRHGWHSSDEELTLTHPKLEELGVSVVVEQAQKMGFMTSITLSVKDDKAMLSQAQVFDAHGKPWPTLSPTRNMFGPSGDMTLIVPGSPEAPLSLAVVVETIGPSVTVPVALSDVPVVPPERPQKARPATEAPSPAVGQ